MSATTKRIQVKNKAPAPVQITAEQLIREGKESELEKIPPPPKQKISNLAELEDYKLRKRKQFEDNIRKNRLNVSEWLQYAAWEDSLNEIERARSIFERALDTTGSRTTTIWLKYIEMEMKNRQVKHARTLFDRATHIFPRVNQFWYKYVHFEEILGNIPECRAVFEKWMNFKPGDQEWQTYINFEMRHKEVDNARQIYSKLVMLHPDPKSWIKFARFEERHSGPENARQVYELALEFFGDDQLDEGLFVAFAQFEERQQEYDRVRKIYQYALDRFPQSKVSELYEHYSTFQKEHGDIKDIEKLIAQKWKLHYEETLAQDRFDYDTWFDYIHLAEDSFGPDEIRDIYERAIASKPEDELGKEGWRRYIYIWIFYANYEENVMKDKDRACQVYKSLIEIIPHDRFTFAKVWILAAKLQVRMADIDGCREILDTALNLCPKRKLFKEYIDIEIGMRRFDNCRRLFKNLLQLAPNDSSIWISYAEVEDALCESARVRALYETAVKRPELDNPENVWTAYIEFETERAKQGDPDVVNKLKQRARRALDSSNGHQLDDEDKNNDRSALINRVKRWKQQRGEE